VTQRLVSCMQFLPDVGCLISSAAFAGEPRFMHRRRNFFNSQENLTLSKFKFNYLGRLAGSFISKFALFGDHSIRAQSRLRIVAICLSNHPLLNLQATSSLELGDLTRDNSVYAA
jgi:hypothetical protein